MNEQYGQGADYNRNEMFAIGAAAGALIATVIQEALDRRRKTPLERARDRAAGLGDQAGEYVSDLRDSAGEYLSGASKQVRKQSKKARKAAKKGGKQVDLLKDAAVGALGAVAATGVLDPKKTAKKAGGWFQSAAESAQEYAATARDTVSDVVPGRKKTRGWWSAASDSVQEYAEAARDAVSDAKVADRASDATSSARGFLESLGTSIAEYLESARDAVVEAELGSRAREVATTARERIEDANIADKARTYVSTAGETLKEAAGTARERIEDAKIAERARDYANVAGVAVKGSATKLGEGASQIAGSAAEGAEDLAVGVKKSVKRTRRRINWGLRAFIIGLVVGLLSAPQSGERTRQSIQGFIESLVDIVLPEGRAG